MKISLIHLLAYSTCTFISTTSAYGAGHHVARSLTDSHGQHKLRMAADLHRRAPVPAQSAPQDPSDGLNDSWYDTEADDEDIEDDEDDLGYLYDDEEDGEPDSSGGQSLVKRKASKGKSKKRKSGLIGYVDKTCGPSGARSKVSKTSGPNGKQSWLNHGISKSHPDSKWSPPAIKLSQLKAVSLSKALSKSDSPFHACKPYLPIFNRVAKQHGLPPIVLASLAMQESSCNADVIGDHGGAFGLMQLITDNCNGRSGQACSEPNFNIETAARLFVNNLKQHNGNILQALGSYNGWYRGMSYRDATKEQNGPNCEWQQNLDYLQQMLNGWFQNISPYQHKLGGIRNLDACH